MSSYKWVSRINISPVNILAGILLIIAVFGFGLAITTFITTGRDDGLFLRHICFNSKCSSTFIEGFAVSFTFAKATIDLLVSIATIGGIVVALLSYLNSAGTAALTNHIAHFSIFQNYVSSEIEKRNRIFPASVDILFWYNFIFSTSRSGKTDVSPKYVNFVHDINVLIRKSNTQAEHAIEGAFRYKQHQERIRDQVRKAGMLIFLSPRNDFFDMEEQLFSLIDRINQSFCYSDAVPALVGRNYI